MTLVLLEAFIYVSVNDEVRFNETIRKKRLSQNFSFFFLQTAMKSFKQKKLK